MLLQEESMQNTASTLRPSDTFVLLQTQQFAANGSRIPKRNLGYPKSRTNTITLCKRKHLRIEFGSRFNCNIEVFSGIAQTINLFSKEQIVVI